MKRKLLIIFSLVLGCCGLLTFFAVKGKSAKKDRLFHDDSLNQHIIKVIPIVGGRESVFTCKVLFSESYTLSDFRKNFALEQIREDYKTRDRIMKNYDKHWGNSSFNGEEEVSLENGILLKGSAWVEAIISDEWAILFVNEM